MPPNRPAVIIAHRTCPKHVTENSLDGIRRAAELGADGVEIDVQRTLDGVPILMHDRTLWRTAGLYRPTRLLPYALLRRLRLQGSTERVPTLAQAPVLICSVVKGQNSIVPNESKMSVME